MRTFFNAVDRRFQRMPLLVRNAVVAVLVSVLSALLGGGGLTELATTFALVYVVTVSLDLATLHLIDARRTYEDNRSSYPWGRGRSR